jgi:O-antigen/teichoic acid export membrane protein
VTTETGESVRGGVAPGPEDSARESEHEGGFRAPVLRGLAWQTATRGTFEASKMIVAVALARLLTPREYGVAGMVLVVISLEQVLGGSAFASVLIQREKISEEDKSTIFWTTAGLGLTVCLVMVSVSWLVADFYNNQQVQPLFAALSLDFLLCALGQVQLSLLVRQMDFKSLEIRSMTGVVIGSVAAIGVALLGGGPWALVIQQLTATGVALVLLWRFSSWRPKFMFSLDSLRSMRGFGARASGTLVMFQLTQNTDNVLIGRFLGPMQLGFYSLAYTIILVPVSRISAPLILVLYPVFSRVQNDLERLASMWLRVLRLMSAVAVPATLGLIVVAPDIVDVVFGHRWQPAIPVIQILATVGLLYGIQGLNGAVLQARDNTQVLFRYSCFSFAAALVAFVVGLHWGIIGVAACFAGVSFFMQPFYMHLTARSVGIDLRACWRALSGVVWAALASTAAALLTRDFCVSEGVPVLLRLVATICAGAAVYLPICTWRAPEVRRELKQLLERRRAANHEPRPVVAPTALAPATSSSSEELRASV